MFQHDDSTNETRNEATLVCEGNYPRHVRGPTPHDTEDEHVVETVKILRDQ